MNGSLTLAARFSAVAVVAGACGLLTACGSAPAPGAAPTKTVTVQASSTSSAPPAAPAAPAVATSSPPPAGPSGCLASGLHAKLGVSQGTAGTLYQVIVLTNTSSASCTLYGYPGVSFVTRVGGSQVGQPATKNAIVPKALVTLTPGGQANALLSVQDAGARPNCKLTTVDWLRIYPPGDFGSLYVQYNSQACASSAVSILAVTPVRGGAGSASY